MAADEKMNHASFMHHTTVSAPYQGLIYKRYCANDITGHEHPLSFESACNVPSICREKGINNEFICLEHFILLLVFPKMTGRAAFFIYFS